MSDRFDAVVVGAGPAGASAALLLARAGWRVALVEKQAFPRRKVCGECIAASNLPLLDALGVGAEIRDRAGAPLRRVALLRGAHAVVAALPAGADPAHPWGLALGREVLDTALLEQAARAGAIVLQPCALQSIGGRRGDYRLLVRHPVAEAAGEADRLRALRTLHAPVVIAAHGSWEPLPDQRGAVRARRGPNDLFAFKANFANAAIAADLLPVLVFDGGYGGMVVADGAVATIACCIREARLEALRAAAPGVRAGDAVEAFLRRELAGVAAALAGATRLGPWLASGPIRPGIRLQRGSDVFAIGNAAGEAHPIVGEGISMALQSAWLLAELLAPERAALLDPARSADAQRRLHRVHAATWRRHFAPRLALAAAFAHVAMRPAATAAAWPLLRAFPSLLTLGARWSGKTESAARPGRIERRAGANV